MPQHPGRVAFAGMSNRMISNTARSQKSIADQTTMSMEFQLRSFSIGVDNDGATHHYYRPADAVVVYDGRDVECVEYLRGRQISEWTDYIDECRGWARRGQFATAGIRADSRRKEAERQEGR